MTKSAPDGWNKMYVRGNNECSRQVGEAVRDAYKAALKPSIENRIFSLEQGESRRGGNPRLRRKPETVLCWLLLWDRNGSLGVDPGYRTGCKNVCRGRTRLFAAQ